MLSAGGKTADTLLLILLLFLSNISNELNEHRKLVKTCSLPQHKANLIEVKQQGTLDAILVCAQAVL